MRRTRQLPKPLYAKHGKQAVLLLHAYSGSPNDVRMLARFLEKADYTVYTPLFKGHGTMEPYDILQEKAESWWTDTKKAIYFLQPEQFSDIAVLGLSMGGISAVRALGEEPMVGGGFFCLPLSPVKTNVSENFKEYVRQVLKTAGKSEKEISEKVVAYRSLVEQQLMDIQDQIAIVEGRLSDIQRPIFLARTGKDEMIDPNGAFETARKLSRQRVILRWYPESGHAITVGTTRRELEKGVLEFLEKLPWNEE